MFGVGPIELFIIAIIFCIVLAIPIVCIVFLFLLYRKVSSLEKVIKNSGNDSTYKFV